MRIFMMILGASVIVLQVVYTLSQRIGCSKAVDAKLVELVKHRGGIGTVKLPVLRYTVDGERYEVEARIHARGWKKEGTHLIYVSPRHPEKIWHKSNWWDCIKVVLLGAFCCALGYIDI